MVSEEATHSIVKRLTRAGFTSTGAKGSHTKWTHPTGVTVIVPTGHRTISPGVVRKVNKSIAEATGKGAK
ncbi:type II toxin-antitoxin system HicA family toxin [Mycobacterium sp. GA-2829]|uniref:type II toxin-antitoxin system HicA family toxin n=1 Tax=Mycobacterium sp. GA-2829 TaxID=1772283 RepID=UPI0009E6DDA9|nr:type II toxin-antitoxin system HicA family toxin [Mycobacterium sp. GA-2829]